MLYTLSSAALYLLTPSSTVLLEKLFGSAASQEFPTFQEPEGSSPYTQVPATCPYAEPTPSSSHKPLSLPEIHLNIILASASGSPQWSLSLRFPLQNPLHLSPILHKRHMPRPSHSSRFYNPHNIR